MARRLLHHDSKAIAGLFVFSLLVACGGHSSDPKTGSVDGVEIASVPMIIAPRVAAAQDGSAWLAWTEGDSVSESLAAAHVDRSGNLSRSQLSPAIEGAQRDVQIIVSGSTPIVAWREYSASGVRVRASAYLTGGWKDEFTADASFDGGPQIILLPDGDASLVWQRASAMGVSELVSSQRSIGGEWSAPVVVASTPPGVTMGSPRHATAVDRSLSVIWTEAPVEIDTTPQPQVLMTSRYDSATGAWGTGVLLDAENGRYYSYDIASTGRGEGVVAWVSGSPIRRPALLSKRWTGTTWEAAPTRVDIGEDYTIRELGLFGKDSVVYAAWIGLAEYILPSCLRVARFDANDQAWTSPSLMESASQHYPELLRLASTGAGPAVAVWSGGNVGGPFLAWTSSSGQWETPLPLDPGKYGLAADISLFSARDLVATWYRPAPQGRSDIVVRYLRIPE